MKAIFFGVGESSENFVCGICLSEIEEAWSISPVTDYEFKIFRKLGFEEGPYACSICYRFFGKDIKKLVKLINQKQKVETKYLK